MVSVVFESGGNQILSIEQGRQGLHELSSREDVAALQEEKTREESQAGEEEGGRIGFNSESL